MADAVVVRRLASNEAGVLRHVARDVFDHDVREDYLRAFLGDPHSLLAVAIDDGVVVGMASGLVYGHPDKPLPLFVNEVGVAPTHQLRGLGRELVRCLLARGRELGCAEAWVANEEENAAARHVLEDMTRTVHAVRASDLDWTVVRVPMLSDDPPKGSVRVGHVGVDTGPRLTRSDMARWMLEQLESAAHVRASPVISN